MKQQRGEAVGRDPLLDLRQEAHLPLARRQHLDPCARIEQLARMRHHPDIEQMPESTPCRDRQPLVAAQGRVIAQIADRLEIRHAFVERQFRDAAVNHAVMVRQDVDRDRRQARHDFANRGARLAIGDDVVGHHADARRAQQRVGVLVGVERMPAPHFGDESQMAAKRAHRLVELVLLIGSGAVAAAEQAPQRGTHVAVLEQIPPMPAEFDIAQSGDRPVLRRLLDNRPTGGEVGEFEPRIGGQSRDLGGRSGLIDPAVRLVEPPAEEVVNVAGEEDQGDVTAPPSMRTRSSRGAPWDASARRIPCIRECAARSGRARRPSG